jgi:hypothetical protein
LQAHAKAKLAEVEARIDDLQIIRTTLLTAIDAGCDDLVACVDSDCCALPFADIVTTKRRSQEVTP